MEHKKKVRIFRQNSSMETCVCCCVLMILDYYHKLPNGMNHPTRQLENRLYRYLGYHINGPEYENYLHKYTKGTPLSAAAYYLAQSGIDVVIYHEVEAYMDNLHHGTAYYPENVFSVIMQKYCSWLEKPCPHLKRASCEGFSISMLTDILNRGDKILAMCFMNSEDGDVLHGILLDQYREADGKLIFHVCNPATGNHELDVKELLWYMDTPVGIQFLSVHVE